MAISKGENERLAVVQEKVRNIEETVKDLKNNELKEIKTDIKNLPDELVKRFDERYALVDSVQSIQSDIKEIKETVDPLTKIRRHIWWLVLVSIVTASIAVDFVKDKLRGL